MSRIQKVIIAEDVKSIHQGLASVLKEINIAETEFVQYCDDAYLLIKKAEQNQEPYHLLITDLSFARDHRDVNLEDGEALIKALKEEQIDIKILVFSIEDRAQKIKKFFKYLDIDAYVCKGRNDQKDLKQAIHHLNKGKKFYSEAVGNLCEENKQYEITNYDIKILELLEEGYHQSEISTRFKDENRNPSSTSSIEKRINNLKNFFKAKNTTNLVAKAKDLGII